MNCRTDLAIDSLDNVHIVYSTKNPTNTIHTINYTTNQGGSWSTTMISDVTKNAFDPAIAPWSYRMIKHMFHISEIW